MSFSIPVLWRRKKKWKCHEQSQPHEDVFTYFCGFLAVEFFCTIDLKRSQKMRKKSQCLELTLNKVILMSLTPIPWAPHLQDQTTQSIALLQLVIQYYPCELHSGVSIDPLLFVFSLYFSVHRCGHLSSLCNYLSENRCAFWHSLFKVLVLTATLRLWAKGDFVCC